MPPVAYDCNDSTRSQKAVGRFQGIDSVARFCNQTLIASRQVPEIEHYGADFASCFMRKMIGHISMVGPDKSDSFP